MRQREATLAGPRARNRKSQRLLRRARPDQTKYHAPDGRLTIGAGYSGRGSRGAGAQLRVRQASARAWLAVVAGRPHLFHAQHGGQPSAEGTCHYWKDSKLFVTNRLAMASPPGTAQILRHDYVLEIAAA